MLKIADITKFTLLDYPNKTACIIWFSGCNMRCQYCHNVELVNNNKDIFSINNLLSFLQTRIKLIDGVVLSGGECSLGGDKVIEFIKQIKQLGFLIKIDTNGLNFEFVKYLIDNSLVNYIALDFKAFEDKFDFITQTKNQYNNYIKTLKLVINSPNIDKEIRTTVHSDLMNENDINKIIKLLDEEKYNKIYYIQNFTPNDKAILNNLGKQKRIIDQSKLIKPHNFQLKFRNF